MDNWAEFLADLAAGKRVVIDEWIYDYFLEVLPPVYMGRRVTTVDGTVVRAYFGFAEGAEPVTAFWREGGRYYCQRTPQINPYAFG